MRNHPRWISPNDLRLQIIAVFSVGIALVFLNLNQARQILLPDVDVPSFLAPDLLTIRASEKVVPIYQGLSNASYAQFCGDCRYSPEHMGRMTCMERAQYLMKTYKQSEQTAIDAVLDAEPHNCKMIRYNITDNLLTVVHNREVAEDVSVFHQRSSWGTSVASSFSSNISIYIYDTIPNKIGSHVEETMARRYATGNISNINFMADVAIIELFRTYPGRTYDPHTAQLFVVPYPHASHCLMEAYTTQWMNECKHVSASTIQKEVLGNLPYFKGNESRHLFITSMETPFVHLAVRNVPLSLNLGPRLRREPSKHIVIPYLNEKESFQPSSIKRFNLAWWTRPRKFSLSYFFGSANKRMRNSQRVHRLYFLEEVRTNWTASPLLGELPYVVSTLQKDAIPSRSFVEKIYKNSVFCPTLPGDAPSQKRFFDVIMMGCIPVVLSFETEMQSASNTSWHSRNGFPIEDSYPWIKGSAVVDLADEIDYKSFVVEVEGGVKNIKPVLETLLNNAEEIRRMQINLMKYASSFSYGMGKDAHKYEDAFHKILQSLHFHLGTIK